MLLTRQLFDVGSEGGRVEFGTTCVDVIDADLEGFLNNFISVEKTAAVELGFNELFEIGGKGDLHDAFGLLKDDELQAIITIDVKDFPENRVTLKQGDRYRKSNRETVAVAVGNPPQAPYILLCFPTSIAISRRRAIGNSTSTLKPQARNRIKIFRSPMRN